MDNALLQYMNADDEPTATEAGNALAAALRRKQDLGTLAALSGGRLAAPGQALLSSSNTDAQALMHAGVARTARADRKSAAELAGLKDLRDFAARQKEQATDNDRAERGIQAQLELARSGQAMTAAGLQLRGHEVDAADDQRARAEKDKAESEVRELSAKVGDAPAMISQKAARLRDALTKYPEGDLPGFGRFTSRLGDSLVSDEGRAVRSDAKELVNTLLSITSGTGVSNTERENKYNAYGLGPGATEGAFRKGFEVLQNDLAQALKAKQAGFKPEAVKTYKERGGVIPEDIAGAPKAAPAQTSTKKKFVIKDGKLVPAGG